jgi:hypothetical protein
MALDGQTASRNNLGLYQSSIQERIDWVIQRARCQSADFKGAGSWLDRSSYMAHHPTAIAAFMCMDGRVNVPLVTNTPRGIIQPFRNLGGRFDLGWSHLGHVVAETVANILKPKRCIYAPLLSSHTLGR